MIQAAIVAAYTVTGLLIGVINAAKPGFTLAIIVFIVAGAALSSLVAALAARMAAQPRPYEAGTEMLGAPQAALSRT
ncbi:hypothetical protein SLNSH_21905 [Alsobacter soli]|uniref:Uncharacterized protein n=1 Tax=Alsobacter soli TaxID=2109933 RepID=A0A2T1HMH2_9HYPH|nr:hypothetical protein [Alsobacter soli]PSC02853.1 hypothetical protein SLNSH_21905 [Alsobacter soli]